jgi:hypothetical protein
VLFYRKIACQPLHWHHVDQVRGCGLTKFKKRAIQLLKEILVSPHFFVDENLMQNEIFEFEASLGY